jgi:hypothetical protein
MALAAAGATPVMAETAGIQRVTNEDIHFSNDEAPGGVGSWLMSVYEQSGADTLTRVRLDASAPRNGDGSLAVATPSEGDRLHLQHLVTWVGAYEPGLHDFTQGSYSYKLTRGEVPPSYTVDVACTHGSETYVGATTLSYAGPLPTGRGWHTVDVVGDRQTLWTTDRSFKGTESARTLEEWTLMCATGNIRSHGIGLNSPGSAARVDWVRFNDETTDFWVPPVARAGARNPERTALAAAAQIFAGWDEGGSSDGWAFPARDTKYSEAVVLANRDRVIEAVAGAPLASSLRGTLLVTPRARLSPRVEMQLRVLARGGEVYLVGGVHSLSKAVADKVRDLGLKVVRVGGGGRYTTAAAVARLIDQRRPTSTRRSVFLATGQDFPDAIIASAAAGRRYGAVLFTRGGNLPPSTTRYLDRHPGARVFAIGEDAVTAARGRRGVTNVAGASRYLTSLAVAGAFFPRSRSAVFANGDAPRMSVVAGAIGAEKRAPVLLVGHDVVPKPISRYIDQRGERLRGSMLLGSGKAVSRRVFAELAEAISAR